MSRLQNIRQSRNPMMQGLIAVPYNECRSLCETEFSSKNNRKQCYSVCDKLRTPSGFIDAEDSQILAFVGECSREFSSDYNSRRCNSGVVQPILKSYVQPELFREQQLVAKQEFDIQQAQQIVEEIESQAETETLVTDVFVEAGLIDPVSTTRTGAFRTGRAGRTGLPGLPTGNGTAQAGFDFKAIPTWGWVAAAAGGAYLLMNRRTPKRRKRR